MIAKFERTKWRVVVSSPAVSELTILYVSKICVWRQISGYLFQASELRNDDLAMGGNRFGWSINVFCHLLYSDMSCTKSVRQPVFSTLCLHVEMTFYWPIYVVTGDCAVPWFQRSTLFNLTPLDLFEMTVDITF
jgi:hypothetical protein